MWQLLLLPSIMSSLESQHRMDCAVRDVVLLSTVYALDMLHVPIARKAFVFLLFYSLLSDIFDDLTFKIMQSNPRHSANWKIVQENNIENDIEKLDKAGFFDTTRVADLLPDRPLDSISKKKALHFA